MHDGIVKIRIEFLSCRIDRRNAQVCKDCYELLVDLLHSLCKGIFLIFFGDKRESSFKIVEDRKDLLQDVLCAHRVHSGFLFLSTLSEIIELSHQTNVLIVKSPDLFFSLFKLLLASPTEDIHTLRFLSVFSFFGCFLSIRCRLLICCLLSVRLRFRISFHCALRFLCGLLMGIGNGFFYGFFHFIRNLLLFCIQLRFLLIYCLLFMNRHVCAQLPASLCRLYRSSRIAFGKAPMSDCPDPKA